MKHTRRWRRIVYSAIGVNAPMVNLGGLGASILVLIGLNCVQPLWWKLAIVVVGRLI